MLLSFWRKHGRTSRCRTLTVNEVVILITKIFFGILYVNQRSLLGIVRGGSDLSLLLGNRNAR
jgi:hypothetical protein